MKFWLGASDPVKYKDAVENGTRWPGPHTSEFAPLPEPTIRTGVATMTATVIALLPKYGRLYDAYLVLHGFGASLLAGAASFAPPPLASFTISAALCWLKWHAGS